MMALQSQASDSSVPACSCAGEIAPGPAASSMPSTSPAAGFVRASLYPSSRICEEGLSRTFEALRKGLHFGTAAQ